MHVLFSLFLPSALAWESPSQEVLLEDSARFFEEVAYDSDWQPPDSPVAIRLRVLSTGGATVEMEGDSTLTWPEALTHDWSPEAGTGVFTLEAGIEIYLDLLVDVEGTYVETTLGSQTVDFGDEVEFDPWLLSGGGDDLWVAVEGASSTMRVFT